MSSRHAPDLRVEVASPPEPGLLRPAIEAALAGRGFAPGPESDVARAVADAVRRAVESPGGQPC